MSVCPMFCCQNRSLGQDLRNNLNKSLNKFKKENYINLYYHETI